MHMKIQYNLPNIQRTILYARLAELMLINPEIFYDDFEINCVYGNFSSCIWDGGGVDILPTWRVDMIQQTVQLYKELNFPICLTFTNPLIDETHLNDIYSNMIASICEDENNQILVASPILEDYLRNKYPKYKYCRSIVASQKKPYDADPKYYKSVLQRAKNNDWDYLNAIPQEHREKIEILCNDPCPDNCPFTYSHYLQHGSYQLALGNCESNGQECAMSNAIGQNSLHYAMTTKAYITHDDIVNKYLPKGFCQFKLAGRDGSMILPAVVLVQYLVKPEYMWDALVQLMQS